MHKDPWSAFQRKPDNDRVHVPWNTDFKPILLGKEPKWGEGKPDEYEWKKGILDKDKFFEGLEDEIERVNKKLGLE